ncbi:hypothetical protein TIFTF001_022608 [Ficus carica]|uniref:Uncharacterized protein n=1 Tax=Ficus carica TaxID=3494 RepID=A0AA88DK10_FICCA|nr:hypothetical protein TIFTF001_022608 [Ficus carica]
MARSGQTMQVGWPSGAGDFAIAEWLTGGGGGDFASRVREAISLPNSGRSPGWGSFLKLGVVDGKSVTDFAVRDASRHHRCARGAVPERQRLGSTAGA